MGELETLHKSLLKNNYDVPEDYESFEHTLTLPGDEGYQNRFQLWKSLQQNNFDVPDNYDDFRDTLFGTRKPASPKKSGMIADTIAAPQQQTAPKGTVNAEDGYIFTEAGLDSLEKGYKPVYVPGKQAQQEFSQPIDLSRPKEERIPESILHPFKQGAEEARQLADSPELNKVWGREHGYAGEELMNPNVGNFGQRMDLMEDAQRIENARQMKRGEFDKQNFGAFYDQHVKDILGEERQAGEQRSQEANKNVPSYDVPGAQSGFARMFERSVNYERETDPEKIANNTLQRVQNDEAFGDYVLQRMGINGQTADGEQRDSPQLSEREKEWMKRLFAKETGEVANQVIQRIYDTYKQEGAPESVLGYIAGKAFHENFAASLYDAMVRRAANSSGIRQQLRAMASEEYGDNQSWLTRMAGGAAPFAVDMLTGGFYVPSVVGQAVVKGGVGLATKQVAKQMTKRAAERGLSGAALEEAASGAAGVAERYLATQAPIMNLAIRTAGSAANFATYESQSEMVRQIAEGEFKPVDLLKEAVHGATLGTLMGATGGLISRATINSGLAGKVAGEIAGIGAETGIFAASSGITKAMEEGIDITDVDWADTTGEALGMVVGMKGVGAAMHPREFLKRYRKSKDYGLQLNQQDIDELKQAGYDFDGIFKGLGEFGKITPQSATVRESAKEFTVGPEGTGTKKVNETESAYVDADAFNKILSNPEISSSVKRKLTYIATGKVLSLEPVFGADMSIDENGKATIVTRNAYGNIIESKEYKNAEKAQKEYELLQEAARTNTIGGLERIADQAGFPDVKDEAKGRTQNETGVDVDNMEQLSELPTEEANKVLDTYIKNLQEAYMQRFNGKMEEIGQAAAGGTSGGVQGAGPDADATGGVARSERRQAAYDRGASVAQDDSQLPGMKYNEQLVTSRMMQQFPDGERAGVIRNNILQAVEQGNMAEAERLLDGYRQELSDSQVEVMEQYLDAQYTRQGVDEAFNQQIAEYEQQTAAEVHAKSDEQGNVTELTLKDGSTVYLVKGDPNLPFQQLIVTTEDGQQKDISSNEVVQVVGTMSADDMIASMTSQYTDQLRQLYDGLANGMILREGQEIDFAMGGQLAHGVVMGQDAQGNHVVQLEDGSRIAMRPDQAAAAIASANNIKVQQLLDEEKGAAMELQRNERFSQGIVGYKEGTPNLSAKDTKPEVAAEYLLSQTGDDGQTVSREQVLKDLQTNIDQLKDGQEQMKQALQHAYNNLAMSEDGSDEQRQAQAVIDQLTPQLKDMEAQQRKWGEIRQAMMNDEERQAFEKDRIKAINTAKTQSKKDVQPEGNAAGEAALIPSGKELLEQYEDRSDAESFVSEQRKQLSQQYRENIYPKWDDIQKQLDDYQHGLTDLTTDEIKVLTDTQTLLEVGMTQLVEAQNAWKKLEGSLGRLYAGRERQNITPHELAMSDIAKESDKKKKLKLAQEAFKDDADALSALENMEPQDVYEWVADHLGAGSLNFEGITRGDHYVRGVVDMIGKDKKRGIGKDSDTNGFNTFLAPTGQGKGWDEVVHAIAEGSPYTTEEVSDALYNMLTGASKPSDISHRIIDDRIAQAEQTYNENLERDRQAQIEFEDDAIRQTTGLEPDEYDAMIADLKQRLAEQEGFENSDDYFKYVEEYEQRETERRAGGGQAQGALALQGQEGERTGSSQEATRGADAANGGGRVEQVKAEVDELTKKYNSLAPIEVIDSSNPTDEQLSDILGQELTPEELADGREYLKNTKEPSFYSPFSKKIYIFADRAGERTKELFLHENLHRWLESIDNASEIFDAFWNASTSSTSEDNKRSIERQYADQPELIPEEFLVNVFGVNMAEGSVEKLLNRLSPEHRHQLEDFLSTINYGTGEEGSIEIPAENESLAGVRKESTSVDIERTSESRGGIADGEETNSRREAATRRTDSKEQLEGNQETAVHGAEQTTEGRKVEDKSSIQGLESYSEEEIKKYVREFVQQEVEDADADAEIVDIAIIGSRTTGTAKPDSDLDVLVEYKGKEREDDLFNLLQDADEPLFIEGIKVDINPITEGKSGTIAEFLDRNKDYKKEETAGETSESEQDGSFAARLAKAKEETNVNPTEAQKEAGNYKKPPLKFGGYTFRIENPKGSIRSGVDKNGNPWSIEMQDTYGYIEEKTGKDGDKMDFFINDDADLDEWNGRVFIVDQMNDDGTFDEHKVMYGYPTWSAARKAYERNYAPGWWDKHVMKMTGTRKVNFDKWLDDSDHKTKPFYEYYRTKMLKDTVSNPMDQLMADVKERQDLAGEPQGTVASSFKEGELESRNIDELKQLKKKAQQDKSTSKVLLGTTNVAPGSLKEKTLKNNIAQAEANIAAIDKVLEQKQAEQALRIEQQEIGGAMVDQLESMGFSVSTDNKENRRIHKQAEQDKSETGKLRHFETPDGKVYGFTYKGGIYLDPTKIDAELPIHEYAHPWCEAFRKLNPQGWQDIVGLMKGDKDTWDFIKQLYPNLKDESDIAEAMIAKFSGKKGAERAKAEYERMNSRDPEYKSKWSNIWKNISKAIQDFWKQVGDFLHIKYKSVDQVYDQVVRDFANKINPRKKVEEWLKERDDAYMQAVEMGDMDNAKEIFDEALRENIGNGITPFVSAGGYRGKMQKLAHGVKTRDPKVIAEVADLMASLIPKDAVLVPAPSHTGEATDMLDLAQAISERTGAPVANVLKSVKRGSQYDAKNAGKPLSASELGITVTGEPLPAGLLPVVIDNVVDTGNTAEACVKALGKGVVASLADSKGRYKRVTSLKSAEPVVTDKNGNVVPLSDRFEFMIGEGSLFTDKDFEEPATEVAITERSTTPQLNEYGLNENTPIGRKLTEFIKKNDSGSTLRGYLDSQTGEYVFLGNDANTVKYLEKVKPEQIGMQDGMNSVRLTERDFDVISPKIVKEGYKFAFLSDDTSEEEPTGGVSKDETPIEEPMGTVAEAEQIPVTDATSLMNEVQRRKTVAEDKKEADDTIKKYLEERPKDSQDTQVRKRATKAVLKAMDNAGVPYKVVSKQEERQMMKLFSLMNQEAIKEMARKPYMRASDPKHGSRGKYIVYNMHDPFTVPMYFEKLSTAKYGLQGMKQLAPEGDWALLKIGLPGENMQQESLKDAADMQAMMGWHGSGAVFTKFDHSHMNEGAGSQVFGWGTYITDNQNIGVGYSQNVSNSRTKYTYKGEEIALSNNPLYMAAEIMTGSKNKREAIKEAEYMKGKVLPDNEKRLKLWDDIIDILKGAQKKDFAIEHPTPMLYKVDIPEDTGENYLDYYKTIKKPQRRKIAEAVRGLDGEPEKSVMFVDYKNGWQSLADMIEREPWAYKEIRERLVQAFGGKLTDEKKVSDLMLKAGFVGVKYPAGTIMGGGEGATNYVIFNEDDAKIVESIQFMIGGSDADEPSEIGQPVFYSNAMKGVEGIKQEKATPEQWLKMIEKGGGLKAGEDKWIGLSDWLKGLTDADDAAKPRRTVTKQEVMDYIRQNQIQVEEQHYQEYFDVDDNPKMQQYRQEFDELVSKYEEKRNKAVDDMERFNRLKQKKYDYGWKAKLNEKEEAEYDKLTEDYNKYFVDNEPQDLAFQEMVDNHGDDFGTAFEFNYGNGKLEPQMDMYGDDISDAAKHFLEFDVQPINSTRLSYTTEGLENKREIALTVPTIEPYNESDQIHFGDAGEGRAVAWVRFGDTEIFDTENRKELDKASEELYDFLDRMSEKYHTNPDEPETLNLTDEEKAEHARIMANIRKHDDADEASTKKVLVIDEIQSKRHQDAREKGYKKELADSVYEAYRKFLDTEAALTKKYKELETAESDDEIRSILSDEDYQTYTSARQHYLDFRQEQTRNNNAVPAAPFEKNWHELAMKRMLRYAAENGYDKIAWTTGAQQAERYNLGNAIQEIYTFEPDDYAKEHGEFSNIEFVPTGNGDPFFVNVDKDGKIMSSDLDELRGKSLGEVVGKELAVKLISSEPGSTIKPSDLRLGGEGMKGFYDDMLVRFMNKYGKKWGVKVEDVDLPEIGQKMHAIDVTPEMKESVMQGQPMFQKEGKSLLGWSDGKQVFLTAAGLNPNTPLHECTHLWDQWCQQEQPELWSKVVAAMKKTKVWEEIAKNPNYRNIWNDENRMASEVHSRLSGATSEEEFMKAAFKKGTSQKIIDEVKSVLRKFWEALLRLFGKHTKTIGSDWDSYDAIVRMPLRDLLNEDFEKVMKAAESRNEGQVEGMRGKINLKAPNGKQSNLSIQQYEEVRTDDFKKYFGDWENDPEHASKVVDENGEPLVVYHGTGSYGFTTFKERREWNYDLNREEGVGIFFSSDRENSAGYEDTETAEDLGFENPLKGTYSVYLNIKNPLVVDYQGAWWNGRKFTYEVKDENGKTIMTFLDRQEAKDYAEKQGDNVRIENVQVWSGLKRIDEYVTEARKNGNDGVIVKNVRDSHIDNHEILPSTTYVVFKPNQIKSATDNIGTFDITNPDINFHIEDDPKTLERLDKEPTETGYRNVVLNEDGTMGSPMADKLGKKGMPKVKTSPFEFQKWERSDENPQLATDNGKIDLGKPDGLGTVSGVDYNPYIHIRPTTVNKQFKNAWERPNLVYIETQYPKSELTSGYHAEKAKLPVGKHPWNGGELILSRWDKPTRIVPWEEVAPAWIEEFKDRGVEFDIVPQGLRPLLVEADVEILPPHKGMGKDCKAAYEEWKAGQTSQSEQIFDAVKNLFGTTYDIREAGYVLPDGTMPDFSGRSQMNPGSDTSFLRGRRTIDHREVQSIAYERDGNTKTGIETDMPDFIRRGAIRIDNNGGTINLATKPTNKQKEILRKLIANNDGYVQVDFGDGWDSDHYVEYDGARPARVLTDIDKYFDEGIKPQGDEGKMFRHVTPAENEANTTYNKQLDEYANGKMSSGKMFDLGEPSPVLKICGVTGKQIKLKQSVLADHMKKHNLTFDDLKDLPSALYHPIMVYQWGDNAKSHVIVTELTTQDGRKVTVTIRVNNAGEVLDVEKITSVHGKDLEHIIQEINTDKTDFAKDNLKYVNKEKALEWLTMDPPKGSRITIQELNSAAKLIKDSDLSKYYAEKIAELYPELTNAVEAAGKQLGGVKVVLEAVAPEEDTLGWYNPNDNSVHVVVPAHADANDAVRTVFHEKLGHEGLVALFGSQDEVNKFGQFIFRSASKDLRNKMMEKADEEGYSWTDPLRFSKAAQEVFGDIAADGPKTADEFDLWTKVKHYIIKFCKALGIKVRGLLNNNDLAYYVVKTGEALKRWNKMSETERGNLSAQSTNYDIMRSRGGKPRQRKGESMASFMQRLSEWEKWKIARETARDNGDPEPTEVTFHEQAEADFKEDLKEWKERNGIGEGETFDTRYPTRRDGESPQEFAMRVADYEEKNDVWKTAPSLMDYLRKANEDYRNAYVAWRERYDLEEESSVDQRLYEGDVEPTPTFTDADQEAQALAERDLAEAAGFEVDEAGAKRHAKLAVIDRRKNLQSANAEDAIWVYDFMKQTDAVAAEIGQRTGKKVTGKQIREALPFLIEAGMRRDNMQAEREDAVMAVNMSDAIQKAHSFISLDNLESIGNELKDLEDAWQDKENNPNALSDAAYHDAAARLAEKLNELNGDMVGYNPLFADDIMQVRSLLTHASVAGGGEVMPASAKEFENVPEVQQLMEHIKDWYDNFYQLLEDAGLRGDAGYFDEYVNHVWDKEKSDAKAWEKYIENRQRTKSPNMRHREIATYMDGISVGLVPKYTDIADMIAHYSRQNNEAVANSRFLDDLKFVVVEEMNDAGEVTAILPLIMMDKPDGLIRDKYAQYYVPGVGDVYVLKHIQKRFANIFGTMRTPDVPDWLSNVAKGYDLTSSTAKKIQLALSGFHALALFEVDVAQNNPITALKHLGKYIIADSINYNTVPAYAHPEDFKLAAKHLVQLGATEDYAAADVNAITAKIREAFEGWSMEDAAWKKAAGTVGSPVAILMDWVNKGFDTVLWNYLHDGLKLCAFKELAKQIDRRMTKLEANGQTVDSELREKLLDEAGQYVNDMFGGQWFDIINVSPALLKWMRRAFLSPDWLLSTQRHFLANFGFGSVYSDSGFRNYIKYNSDNIQRLLGKDVPHDELRRLRSKNAKYCYMIGAIVWWGLFYNAINALCRWKDEKDEKDKADEIRKTNPNYKSPYELAYPDGMKWYDYTMYGNTIGQNTHLFTGRYSDGTETYVRWGKQFREFPELFIGRHGLEFPSPIIQRMMSKANPNVGTMIDFLGAQNIGGFNGSYENKELREKYGKTVATLAALQRHFIPFGMPTQADKEYKWLDFFMPSSKGFSRWKAKDYFETFILDGDWDGIEQTYNACVMNGIDAEANLNAAISSIKAAQKRELSDGVTDLSTATAMFDSAKTPEERAIYLNKIKKYLKENVYKVLTKEEAIEKVRDFIEGTDVKEKENKRYVMLATSEDVIAEEKLRDLGRRAKKFKKELESRKDSDDYETLKNQYGSWLKIDKIVGKAVRSINKSKKQLGGMHEDSIMKSIRETISQAQQDVDELEAPK